MVLDPTIANWALVPAGKKEAMWQLLSGTFFSAKRNKRES